MRRAPEADRFRRAFTPLIRLNDLEFNLRRTWLSRLAGVVFFALPGSLLAQAQPATPVAPPSAAIEIEDDVEVVATPAPAAAAGQAPDAGVRAVEATPPTALTQAAVTPAPAATEAAVAAPPPSAANVAALEARIAALEAAEAASADAAPQPPPTPPGEITEPWLGIKLTAYLQAQYESSQASEDQLQQGGEPLNRDRFVVRRARVRLERSWQYAGLDLELDANTVRGIDVGLRRAAGAVFWPGPDADSVPYVRAQAGLLDQPFGYELPAGARQRLFAERSTASLAFFPSEADVGAAIDGGYGPLRYALAVLNGQESDASYRILDANSAKDLLARVGVEVAPREDLEVLAGVSFVEGTGFHPGGDATKNTLVWNDINEDGSKTDAEVFGEPGSSVEPSKNFDRWAIGLDARVGLRTTLGWSRLSGEVSFAQNLDRGLFVADPVASSLDARELGYYIAFVQEITPYLVVGFRADYYDGNSDFIERRRGKAFKQPLSLRTWSPVVGVVLPGRARLALQYDFIDDTLGRDRRGEPADLKNNQWTLRLQVGL